ncbi:TerC family protein [Paenibacillus sp. 481]|uniref:TerC family protein n=1 Tax=Paenibacillus sp. 481 TaxID=2835869 RepID=UPI001E3C8F57|nr:TerC family protein [Paenibacillus sp. 481]UHA74788.1 TerC family protein [Paenibacillus sp. 481]
MDFSLFLEYAWVLVVLIGLEGLLAADNALVIATMVKHLDEEKRKKALFYGLAGAFLFRFGSLFIIAQLVNIWQVQAIGAVYLIFISVYHLLKKFVLKPDEGEGSEKKRKGSGLWFTILKVELADLAFAVDSILAAVALAVTLPATGLGTIGGMDAGQFIVIFIGGFIGVVIMRYAAQMFVKLLNRKPGLETAAFMIVGWVGIKLAVFTLSHPELAVLPEGFSKSPIWKGTFFAVLILIAVVGWFMSKDVEPEAEQAEKELERKNA